MKIKNKRVIEYFKTDDTLNVDSNLLQTIDLRQFTKEDYEDLKNIFLDVKGSVNLPQLFPHEIEGLYDNGLLKNPNIRVKMKTESIFDVSDDLINKMQSQEILADEIELIPSQNKGELHQDETVKQIINRIIPKIGTKLNVDTLAKIKELADEVLQVSHSKRIDARSIGIITDDFITTHGLDTVEITGKVTGDYLSNLSEILSIARLTKVIQFDENFHFEGLRGFMENHPELSENLLLSSDGGSLINTERLTDQTVYPQEIHIDMDEFRKRADELITGETNDSFVLVINNTSELSVEEVRQLQQSEKVSKVKVFSPENMSYQNEEYDLDTYIGIREKLDELVSDIDLSLPDAVKFAIVYQRLGQSIVYDTPAAYPKTDEEIQYSDNVVNTCRNLKNGLLEGKCVCAGYADILRNALAMVGIEAQYTSGTVIEGEMSKDEYEQNPDRTGYIYETKDDGETVVIAENHAWNKVKLNGTWFNVDLTFDATLLRNGQVPEHCLKPDQEIKSTDNKTNFEGPECNTFYDSNRLQELFELAARYPKSRLQVNLEKMRDTVVEYINKGKEAIAEIPTKIAGFIQRIRGQDVKLLEEVNPQAGEKKEEVSSWDLSNWDIDKNEFNKETRQIIELDGEDRPNIESQKDGDVR